MIDRIWQKYKIWMIIIDVIASGGKNLDADVWLIEKNKKKKKSKKKAKS